MITRIINDESQIKKKSYKQTGQLIYGRQDIYEFTITVSPYPEHPGQAKFDFYVWTDPGGFIADWMIREATELIAPEYMRILEEESQKRAGKVTEADATAEAKEKAR